jgi:hypothetical protein
MQSSETVGVLREVGPLRERHLEGREDDARVGGGVLHQGLAEQSGSRTSYLP